jgi:hypothetical protein
VFDGSSRPQRVEYREGDADLRSAEPSLTDGDYPISFPDNSSVQIVRQGRALVRRLRLRSGVQTVGRGAIPAGRAEVKGTRMAIPEKGT